VAKPHRIVPKNTVVGFIVSPKNEVLIERILPDFGLRFDKAPIPEMADRFLYLSEDGSIEIDTERVSTGGEKVLYIAYRPTKSQGSIRCSSRKQ
jgi:hypothetical protein